MGYKKKVEIFLKKVLTFVFESGIIVKRSRESGKNLRSFLSEGPWKLNNDDEEKKEPVIKMSKVLKRITRKQNLKKSVKESQQWRNERTSSSD